MKIRRCCKICFAIQLIAFSVLICGAIVVWGSIELKDEGWETASIYLKFSCIAAGFLIFNMMATGIFYCIVWIRAVKRERESTQIEMDQQQQGISYLSKSEEKFVVLKRDSEEHNSMWNSEESASEMAIGFSPRGALFQEPVVVLKTRVKSMPATEPSTKPKPKPKAKTPRGSRLSRFKKRPTIIDTPRPSESESSE